MNHSMCPWAISERKGLEKRISTKNKFLKEFLSSYERAEINFYLM